MGYAPYYTEDHEAILPKIGDVLIVEVPEGQTTNYQSGQYRVLEVETFGHSHPIGWVLRLEPLRDAPTEIPVGGIQGLLYVNNRRTEELTLDYGDQVCIPYRVLPLGATDKRVAFQVFGNLVYEEGRLRLLEDTGIGGILRVTTLSGGFSFDITVNGYEMEEEE